MIFRCPAFDLNDQKLIERASRTGAPRHIAQAIKAATRGTYLRIFERAKEKPLPVFRGEIVIPMCTTDNFFDEFCQRVVCQGICDMTGKGVMRIKHNLPAAFTRRPISAYVVFL